VSSVTNVVNMFLVAEAFNQNLCPWGKFPSFPYDDLRNDDMFADSGCLNTNQPINSNGPFCSGVCIR